MLATTFLGHQGWMFRSAQNCILLDPLLGDDFGGAQALDYSVYPPRVLDFAGFPAVDAVILSHEHDDHFDIPSLARLDRAIPIHLSARSSAAAHTLLAEMGFRVRPLVPGRVLTIGELEVHAFPGDHLTAESGDEWDALALLVRHRAGGASFFTAVDLAVTKSLIEAAREREHRPGLIGWTNNTIDRSFMTDFQPVLSDATASFAKDLASAGRALRQIWGEPSATLICGCGFAFRGERSFLNSHLFCVDAEQVARQLGSAQTAGCFAPRPGQTFHMEAGALSRVESETPFLRAAPTETWPARTNQPSSKRPDYAPATGRREMQPAETEQLLVRLQELADALVGSRLFRGLYSLTEAELAGRRGTFALVLRHRDQAGVFEYNPNACRFERSRETSPRSAYLAGLECWATDFLAVLSGELGPIAISFGRAALWNAAPASLDFSLLSELYRISHPLRRPAAYLHTYRNILRSSASIPIGVRAAGAQ